MVWDICDAKFAIYEEVPVSDGLSIEAYPEHSKSEDKEEWLVGVNVEGSEQEVKRVQKELSECMRKSVNIYSSVYKHGGKKAQPDKHPEIEEERVGSGEWLVVVLFIGGEAGDIEGLVGEWAKDKERVDVGVWKGEVDMV